MYIKELGKLLLFDEFPSSYDPNQRIILTNLISMTQKPLPDKLPIIYTTPRLASQFQLYCEHSKYKNLTPDNIFCVDSYNFIDLALNRFNLQILFCESSDLTCNLMVLIRKDGLLSWVYGGNFMDIRTAILNDTISSWVSKGVEKLYLNLKFASIAKNNIEKCLNPLQGDLMQLTLNHFDIIYKYYENPKINLHIPPFGYEQFLQSLVDNYIRLIWLDRNVYLFLENILQENCREKLKRRLTSAESAKIKVYNTKVNYYISLRAYQNEGTVTINLICPRQAYPNIKPQKKTCYYELFYSPEPSLFYLHLMCLLLKPQTIYSITNNFYKFIEKSNYLKALCTYITDSSKESTAQKTSTTKRSRESSKVASDGENNPKKYILLGAVSINSNTNTTSSINGNNLIQYSKSPFLQDSESDSE